MLVVVTGVSALVHLYSTSYMHGEERYPRFFSYLSLFTFSMLGLVITSNLLLLFMFWELVGVCSYFLIGFYIEKKSAGDASKKAFITNRVGDACFMLGHHDRLLGPLRKTMKGQDVLSFQRIYESIGELGPAGGPWTGNEALLTAAGILVFMGCVSKSAQFPLHIWLPDAMEGPTPVSALIHAATMVAAGVYLIARMFPLIVRRRDTSTGDYFHGTPLMVVAIVGGFTSLFAGSIALVQQDLKKGLAYSTVLAARLHGDGRRRRQRDGRHVPPVHARVLQGVPVPRRGIGDPRRAQPDHGRHGRAPEEDAGHVLDLPRLDPGDRGHARSSRASSRRRWCSRARWRSRTSTRARSSTSCRSLWPSRRRS